MNKIQLKSNLHDIVDQIDNVELLKKYYAELKKLVSVSKANMWENLSSNQQNEILDSFEESESEHNLVENSVAVKKLKKHI
jgi:hypothetical protein